MKNRTFMMAIVLSAVLYRPAGWSVENPGIGNPVGPATIPPSVYRNSLVNNPSPIDTSGNLLMTGNVRRGRHFRGDMPYRSTTSFGSNLGSSALSSFLRDTAGSEDFQNYSNKYGTQPYYPPTETVTTTMPGRAGIFMPENAAAGARIQQNARSTGAGVSGLEFQPEGQALFSQAASAADSGLQGSSNQYGPLAQSRLMLESKFPTNVSQIPRSTERLTPAQIGMRRQNQNSSAELFMEQVQDIRENTQSTGWPDSESINFSGTQSLKRQWEKNESFRQPSRETNVENLRPEFGMLSSSRNVDDNRTQTAYTQQGISSLEQIKSAIDSTTQTNPFLQRDSNLPAAGREFQTPGGRTAGSSFENPERPKSYTPAGQGSQQGDVLEQIRQQLEDLTKSLDATIQRRDSYKDASAEPVSKREQISPGYQQYIPDSRRNVSSEPIGSGGALNYYQQQGTELGFNGRESAPAAGGRLNQADTGGQNGLDFTGMPNYGNAQKSSSPLAELNKLSQADISAEANRIKGSHNSLESLSQSKFNQHMLDAEEHLRAGRYYRAASCFSLALIYQADNPSALAGRGHALLAAGEYVSSALFLSRALVVNPEYLQINVDLVAIIGDERKLVGRISDIEQWLARSGSSQLQFLLGYVYFRTGRLLQAKQAIDAAYSKTPDSPALQAVKITIDNMMMRR